MARSACDRKPNRRPPTGTHRGRGATQPAPNPGGVPVGGRTRWPGLPRVLDLVVQPPVTNQPPNRAAPVTRRNAASARIRCGPGCWPDLMARPRTNATNYLKARTGTHPAEARTEGKRETGEWPKAPKPRGETQKDPKTRAGAKREITQTKKMDRGAISGEPCPNRTHLGSTRPGPLWFVPFLNHTRSVSQLSGDRSGAARGRHSTPGGRSRCSEPAGAAVRDKASATALSSAGTCPTA